MGIRFREVASKIILERLTKPGNTLPPTEVLDREVLGRQFHPKGRKFTEKQLTKVAKYYYKFVERLKAKIDKADAKAKAKAKNPKPKRTPPVPPKREKTSEKKTSEKKVAVAEKKPAAPAKKSPQKKK